jgi:chromosome segregation ATPase
MTKQESTVTELKVKLQARTLKLTDAEQTIEVLKHSLESTKAALEQALVKNHALEVKLKNVGNTWEEQECNPKFYISWLESLKDSYKELGCERGKA